VTLAPSTRLGPYEIVAPLGAGGMGEVYRARDTRLGREVAVKVLPGEVASDPDRLRRFEQEAKAASSLNHPGILTVHDFGSHDGVAYLVTELLDGESLRETARRGPLPTRRAVELAIQIAKGLAVAHDRGIVHRDLKPENLFVTRDGHAKILDFGLARVERPELSQANLNDVSTVLETQAGTVLGTVGYMAPEQVRGERADARSDLFSLGVVLHELLSGANPFRRDSVVESLNAILKEEPVDLAATPSAADPALARLVARLLEKEPARRFRSAHDLVFALEATGPAASGSAPGRVAAPQRRARWPLAVAALALSGLAFGVGRWWPREAGGEAVPVRFEIQPPAEAGFESTFEAHNFALSPDGKTLAYVARAGGPPKLHLRDVDRVEARVLDGTEGAHSPFWSPDGAEIAYFARGKLKRIARGGGEPQTVCAVQGSNTGSWGRRGDIVFSQAFGPRNGLFRVAAGGGSPQPLSVQGVLPRWMEFLPDGRRFLVWNRPADSFEQELYVFDLAKGGVVATLSGVAGQARYAEPGWLVYARADALLAERFDPERAVLLGDPVTVATGLPIFFNGWASFTVGGRAIAYQTEAPPSPLVWRDRHGRELGRVGPPARYQSVRLSPDERSAAVTRSDPATAFTDVWVVDLDHGGASRLSDEPYLDHAPTWSPEGDRIVYATVSPGPRFTPTVRRLADASVVATLEPSPTFRWPRAWLRAGLFLDRFDPERNWDLEWHPTLESPSQPVLSTAFNEALVSPSPDGTWLAFFSNESGAGEIVLARRDAPGRRIRVSRGAQDFVPRWRGDGGELFYVSAERWLTAVEIGPGEAPRLGAPLALFPVDLAIDDGFDVTSDGERFLLAATPPASSLPVTVALDWQSALPER